MTTALVVVDLQNAFCRPEGSFVRRGLAIEGVDEIVARGHDIATVHRVEHLLYLAEYKRRQSAPGVKITPC